MQILGTHFEKLLENIRPPDHRIEAAQQLPPLVRDYLAAHPDFVTLAPHTRLAGSYAQNMSVGDVKDVDFLVRVTGEPVDNEPEAKHLIQELRNVLDGLPEALGYKGHAESQDMDIERARRSVHVYMEGRDFHIDVVPCIAPDGFEAMLYVPDRGFNKWIASHPIGYIQLLDELNNANSKKVKPLGKLLKHFRNYQMKTRRPKSYWLGALLIYHVENTLDMSEPLAVLFRDLLGAIYSRYDHLLWVSQAATPNISDPLLGHNISWNWGRAAFETFMRRLDEGRKWADKALESEDREVAIEQWQRIFGEEYFPTDVTAEAEHLAKAMFPGASFVSSSGLVTADRPQSGLYTPTKPTTFHGPQG